MKRKRNFYFYQLEKCKLDIKKKKDNRLKLGMKNTKTNCEKHESISFQSTFKKNRSPLLCSARCLQGDMVEGTRWFLEVIMVFNHTRCFSKVSHGKCFIDIIILC